MEDYECCPDWKPNVAIIDGLVVMDAIHGGNGYNGKKWAYCPWCGKEIKANEQQPNIPTATG